MADFPITVPYEIGYYFQSFRQPGFIHVQGALGTSDGTTASITTHKFVGKTASNITITSITARLSAGGTRAGTGAAVPVFALYAASNYAGTGITGTAGTYDCGTAGEADGSLISFTLGAGVDIGTGSYLWLGESVGEDAYSSDMVMNDLMIEYKVDYGL